MMIALAAVGFKNGDIAYNKEKIISVIRDHRYQADLILFGETFLQGFDSLHGITTVTRALRSQRMILLLTKYGKPQKNAPWQCLSVISKRKVTVCSAVS